MAKEILTADEAIRRTLRHQKRTEKEKSDFERQQAKLEAFFDLRDDLVSAISNFAKRRGISYEAAAEIIHSRCGPHPSTTIGYRNVKTRMPRLGKLVSAGKIVGLRLQWVEEGEQLDDETDFSLIDSGMVPSTHEQLWQCLRAGRYDLMFTNTTAAEIYVEANLGSRKLLTEEAIEPRQSKRFDAISLRKGTQLWGKASYGYGVTFSVLPTPAN